MCKTDRDGSIVENVTMSLRILLCGHLSDAIRLFLRSSPCALYEGTPSPSAYILYKSHKTFKRYQSIRSGDGN